MLTVQELKKIYSSEQVVLVLLARLYFLTADKNEVTNFINQNNINWSKVYAIAKAHGVRAFTYYCIINNQISTTPEFEARLKANSETIRLKSLQQATVATRFINQLQERQIFVIPYKGPFFAQRYYADIALRESIDIDFLVDEKNVAAIEDYCIANNYTAKLTVARGYLNFYKKAFKDIVYRTKFTDNSKAFSVEIHWKLIDRFAGNYPTYSFFKPHSKKYDTDLFNTYALEPTHDFLITVSNHFVKDMCSRFKYLIDIACLISKEQPLLDKEIIFNTAKKYGFTKKLTTGLSLVEDLLGLHLNNFPLTKKDSSPFLKTVLQFPLALNKLYITEPTFIKRSLLLQDNLWHQCKFLIRCLLYIFIPTTLDINNFKLPAYCLPLLIIIRPFRLGYEMLGKYFSKNKSTQH